MDIGSPRIRTAWPHRCLPILLSLVLSGAAGGAAADAPQAAQEITLIGVLTRQYTPGCEDGKDVWREPSHLEIGFVRVQVPAHLRTKGMEGKVVLARGRTVDEKVPEHRVFDNGGLCSIVQMRSDWVVSQGGIRRYTERRGALGRMAVFAATSLQVVDPPTFATRRPQGAPDEQVEVRFKNPVGEALDGLVIEGRYEGCFGKPGATSREVAVGKVARGGVAEATLPRLISDQDKDQGRRGRSYRLDSVRVISSGGGVVFDLDYPVGTKIAGCPRD